MKKGRKLSLAVAVAVALPLMAANAAAPGKAANKQRSVRSEKVIMAASALCNRHPDDIVLEGMKLGLNMPEMTELLKVCTDKMNRQAEEMLRRN